MITLTTKQLRENMSQVVRDLQKGKSVQLCYRHKVIGVLEPIQRVATPMRRGSADAVRDFLSNADFGKVSHELQDSALSFKQQIADLRNRTINSK